jgi:NAD(P)-dependent dehydrogenase (short-subunit alcohol dehydrogenase family)
LRLSLVVTAVSDWRQQWSLLRKGAYVFITGRRQKELDAAVGLIGRNVTAVQGDVSKLADLDRLYAQVAKEKGRVDIVFANAGIGLHDIKCRAVGNLIQKPARDFVYSPPHRFDRTLTECLGHQVTEAFVIRIIHVQHGRLKRLVHP